MHFSQLLIYEANENKNKGIEILTQLTSLSYWTHIQFCTPKIREYTFFLAHIAHLLKLTLY